MNYRVITGLSLKMINNQQVVSIQYDEYNENNELVKDNIRVRTTLVRENRSNSEICNVVDNLLAYSREVVDNQ